MLSSDKPKRKRVLETDHAQRRCYPGGDSFLVWVEIREKGSVGKSCTSAACSLRGRTLGSVQLKHDAGAEHVSDRRGAPAPGHPAPHARRVPFTRQLTRAFVTRVSTNQLPTVRSRHRSRGSCFPLSARALCKPEVGSYFHTTFVRSEVNRLHHSYLNLQKELVGSGQRVKNAFTYLGALLYATSPATRLCWKG